MHGALELLYEVPQSREDHLDETDRETVEPRESRYIFGCADPYWNG